MLLCVRERSVSDSHNRSSLQRQFSHGHDSPRFKDGVSSAGTRVSHFLPTSRRIVQFSNGKVCKVLKTVLFISSLVASVSTGYSMWMFVYL